MPVNMNDVKKHPGFMPFGYSNVKVNEDSQAKKESERDSQDKQKDTNKA